jgi:hypothetical protein
MSPAFKNGTSVNVHSKGRKMKHLRIKAGPQRDCYLHDIIFRAKILGRREAYMREHGLINDLSIPENEFYSYLDTTFETVDHDDQDSLNNEPSNLVRMTRGRNAAKANKHRAEQRKKESNKSVYDFP